MLEVIRTGPLALVVDQGRPGLSRFGVPRGGALDDLGLAALQRMLGNPGASAGIEVWSGGLALTTDQPLQAAYLGAGEVLACGAKVPPGIRFALAAGDLLEVRAGAGFVTTLAFAGGIDLPQLLGSRSYLDGVRGEGPHFRSLRQGDVLPLGREAPAAGDSLPPRPQAEGPLLALPGPEMRQLSRSDRHLLFGPFRVGSTNRMGARLQGPPLSLEGMSASRPLVFGTVQLPPAGGPILCLSGHGATGGYARVWVVASVERARLPWLREGMELSFQAITADRAHRMLDAMQRWSLQPGGRCLRIRVGRQEFKVAVQEQDLRLPSFTAPTPI